MSIRSSNFHRPTHPRLRSFFYSGLLRRKNALSMMYLSMMCVGVVSFQWFFWGYSLTFSNTAGKFIGDFSAFFPFEHPVSSPAPRRMCVASGIVDSDHLFLE